MKTTINEKSKVIMDYTIEDMRNKVIDDKVGIEVDMSEEKIFSKLYKALIGCCEGEHLKVRIDKEENEIRADEELKIELKKSDFIGELKVGDYYKAKGTEGNYVGLRIGSLKNEKVFVDGNHPLMDTSFVIKAKVVVITNK